MLRLLAAPELERRRAEVAESLAEEPAIPGGFALLEEVVARATLMSNTTLLVKIYTPGIVVGPAEKQGRITVKFERREDGSELCVNVLPSEICQQIPQAMGFRLGEVVAASTNLSVGDRIVVGHGVPGVIEGMNAAAGRLNVRFQQRCDGNTGMLSVLPFELMASGPFAGGYVVAQRVEAAADLYAGQTCLVRQGTTGTVYGPYNDIRLVVRFDERLDGQPADVGLNVLPTEIRPAGALADLRACAFSFGSDFGAVFTGGQVFTLGLALVAAFGVVAVRGSSRR